MEDGLVVIGAIGAIIDRNLDDIIFPGPLRPDEALSPSWVTYMLLFGVGLISYIYSAGPRHRSGLGRV